MQSGLPVMLLYVLESKGSSPGRAGFFMAVTDDVMQGSVGGGMMEHKLAEKARTLLKKDSFTQEIVRQVHNKSAAKNQSGMICSGEQTVLLHRVGTKDKAAIEQITACFTYFHHGTLTLSASGIAFEKQTTSGDGLFRFQNEKDWLYRETIGYKNHLYIIGGGHCSLALSALAATLHFYIHLYDNREALPTFEQNETAHQKTRLADYSELASLIPSGENSYVVVMTVGYRTDDAAIRALFGKDFKYIGVLGSKAKIQKMFAAYRREGFDAERLKRIHAPVGLPIKSKTPEEIAVSIAAEIIAMKNRPAANG